MTSLGHVTVSLTALTATMKLHASLAFVSNFYSYNTVIKNGYITAIGSCSMKMVADRHRRAAYHNKQ